MLSNVKAEIDNLLHDSSKNGSPSSAKTSPSPPPSPSYKDDMKILIDNYETCCKKLNELNEKSQIKGKQVLQLVLKCLT
jgi:hypothetical protein